MTYDLALQERPAVDPRQLERGFVSARPNRLADRVLQQAMTTPDPVQILTFLCEALIEAGVPLRRSMVGFEIIHPLIEGRGVVWRRGAPAESIDWLHGRDDNGAWQRSPFYHMEQQGLAVLQLDPSAEANVTRFPVLKDFGELALTDYLALMIPFGANANPALDRDGFVMSLAADGTGFAAEHLALIEGLRLPLAAAFRLAIEANLARTVMETYHGRDAGQRILAGRIRRGDGEWLRTVIWMSDLRNSTGLAKQLPVDRYLAVMNAYADCAAGAVLAAGGEVLEIIGDAVLGIFPVRDGTSDSDAATRAVAAARDARHRLADLHQTSACEYCRVIEFGVGIHWGELVYGNVGTPDRLNFGLIGPAVNEAARLENLTKTLGRPILVSRTIADLAPGPWDDLGRQDLRGVGRPIQVFAPALV